MSQTGLGQSEHDLCALVHDGVETPTRQSSSSGMSDTEHSNKLSDPEIAWFHAWSRAAVAHADRTGIYRPRAEWD